MSRADAREDHNIHVGDTEVVVLRYGEPHNCWRIEVRGCDLEGELSNMTADEAEAVGGALIDAADYIRARLT